MAFLDITVFNVALPAVQADLEAAAAQAQWVYGAFALVLAAFVVVGGYLGDCYGRRRVFVVGAAIFAATSVWCVSALGAGHLIAARAAQGPDGALLVPASLAIVGASFEGKLRAKAIGAWGALSGTAMAVGPVLGGWLVKEATTDAPATPWSVWWV
jgi:MFS family permease